MVPPRGLIAAAEARTGRPWAHTWAQIEALVGATVVAALHQAKRDDTRQTQHSGEVAAGAAAPSCEHTVVAFDVILAGDAGEQSVGAANRVDAHTEFGAGDAEARPLRPLRPFLIEASYQFGFGGYDRHVKVLGEGFSRDLLSWLSAQAEGAAVHECRPRHEQPPGAFHFRRIVPACVDQGGRVGRWKRRHQASGGVPAKQNAASARDAAYWLSEAARLRMSGAAWKEALESALAIDPLHASAHYNRGVALGQLGAAPEEQLACYESALAVDPLYVTAHVNRGVALQHMGAAPEEQIACYESALAIDPLHASAHYSRGVALGQLGAAPWRGFLPTS